MADVWQDRAVLPAHGVGNPGRYVMGYGDCAIGSKLYVVGGIDQTPVHTAWLDIYDSDLNTWSSGATYPPGGRSAMAVGVIDGKLYSTGGGSDFSGTFYKTGWYYTPGSDSWTAIADMPVERMFAGAAVHDGYLWVVSGIDTAFDGLNTIIRYDPVANSWASGFATMPAARSSPAVVALNDYLYVVGGSSAATLYRYDIAGDSWTTLTSIPTPTNREGSAITALNGKLYVANGSMATPSVPSTHEYNPGIDSWTVKTAPTIGANRLAYGTIDGQFLHVVGGFRGAADFRDEHQRYTAIDLGGWQIHAQII